MGAPMTVADVLDAAADLIEPEGRWTQGCTARDGQGRQVPTESGAAVSFCMWAAIAKVSGDYLADNRDPIRAITKPWGVASTPENLGRWNDAPGRTQAEVVAKLREAAAAARRSGDAA